MAINQFARDLFLQYLDRDAAPIDRPLIETALVNLLGGENGRIDLASIIAQLDADGFSTLAGSWLGDGTNRDMSIQHIETLFGSERLERFAAELELEKHAAAIALKRMLPELIDRSSRAGRLLDETLISE